MSGVCHAAPKGPPDDLQGVRRGKRCHAAPKGLPDDLRGVVYTVYWMQNHMGEVMSTTPAAVESPLFVRFYDLLAWLVGRVEKFPRSQRFVLASRLLDTAFTCHARLIRARKVSGAARQEALLQADVGLETLRLQLRLAHELRCINTGQYEYGAMLVNEIGKMLGSWRR